jgi:hypothetical protein
MDMLMPQPSRHDGLGRAFTIFEDAARRQTLVAVLELFSSAGWPEALKVLFELPDLLR